MSDLSDFVNMGLVIDPLATLARSGHGH